MLTMIRLELEKNAGAILEVRMPPGTPILHFGDHEGRAAIWFLADAEDANVITRYLFMVMDGMSIPKEHAQDSRHLFSSLILGQAWHLFEMQSEKFKELSARSGLAN